MSQPLIKFYKGVVLEQIHTKLVADGTVVSIDEVDELLKSHADSVGSCSDMSKEELKDLVEWSKQFAASIGLDIDEGNGINFKF